MANHSHNQQTGHTARGGRPRGDGVRGPIICFALGLALAIAGVSGGSGAVSPADASLANSGVTALPDTALPDTALPDTQPISDESDAHCSPDTHGFIVYSPGADECRPVQCDPPKGPSRLLPLPANETMIEAVESIKESCARGFTFFRLKLEDEKLKNTECTIVFAHEDLVTEVPIADSLEIRYEAETVTLGCDGA